MDKKCRNPFSIQVSSLVMTEKEALSISAVVIPSQFRSVLSGGVPFDPPAIEDRRNPFSIQVSSLFWRNRDSIYPDFCRNPFSIQVSSLI